MGLNSSLREESANLFLYPLSDKVAGSRWIEVLGGENDSLSDEADHFVREIIYNREQIAVDELWHFFLSA